MYIWLIKKHDYLLMFQLSADNEKKKKLQILTSIDYDVTIPVAGGWWVRQTFVPKHIWTCSNVYFIETKNRWVTYCRAVKEVVCIHVIMLAENE